MENQYKSHSETSQELDSFLNTMWNLMVASALMKHNNRRNHEILEVMERIIALGSKMENISKIDNEIKEDLTNILIQDEKLGWLGHHFVNPDYLSLEQNFRSKCDKIFSHADWKKRMLDTLDLTDKDLEEERAEEKILNDIYQELQSKIYHVCKLYRHFLPLVFWSDPEYIKKNSNLKFSSMISEQTWV